MKAIFLDIDGVLVTWDDLSHWCEPDPVIGRGFHRFHKSAVANLNVLIKETGAFLVLSSTWRKGSEEKFLAVRRHIERQGVRGTVIARTCDSFQLEDEDGELTGKWSRRGHEIQKWLDCHENVDKFVIIDDDSDMEHLLPYLVKTNMDNGLTFSGVEKAIEILGRVAQ